MVCDWVCANDGAEIAESVLPDQGGFRRNTREFVRDQFRPSSAVREFHILKISGAGIARPHQHE